LLTGTGWKPINSLEAIFLQIKLEMTMGKPRVDFEKDYDYSESEAKEAFFRVAGDHGWDVNGLK
jgi:ubiquitin-conjugating enzyme E2 Q